MEYGGEMPTIEQSATVLKGVMWQQRDKVFSRWKERYFVLTSDYLQCFKKSSPSVMHSAASEMGRFIFKLKLTEVSQYVSISFGQFLSSFSLNPNFPRGTFHLYCPSANIFGNVWNQTKVSISYCKLRSEHFWIKSMNKVHSRHFLILSERLQFGYIQCLFKEEKKVSLVKRSFVLWIFWTDCFHVTLLRVSNVTISKYFQIGYDFKKCIMHKSKGLFFK